MLLRVFIVRIVVLFIVRSLHKSVGSACALQFKSAAMASSLASDAYSFLHQLLTEQDKQEDALISEWDDEMAEHHPHEGHVLLSTGPIQQLMNCLTYETITLSGHLVYSI